VTKYAKIELHFLSMCSKRKNSSKETGVFCNSENDIMQIKRKQKTNKIDEGSKKIYHDKREKKNKNDSKQRCPIIEAELTTTFFLGVNCLAQLHLLPISNNESK